MDIKTTNMSPDFFFASVFSSANHHHSASLSVIAMPNPALSSVSTLKRLSLCPFSCTSLLASSLKPPPKQY